MHVVRLVNRYIDRYIDRLFKGGGGVIIPELFIDPKVVISGALVSGEKSPFPREAKPTASAFGRSHKL